MKRVRADEEYTGFKFTPTTKLAVIEAPSAREFFERFVATRTPCLIKGLTPGEFGSNPLHLISDDIEVEVEERPYGSGLKRAVLFKDFKKDMDNLYLTTQSNQSTVVSPPLAGVKSTSFPLAGHLTLANLNCWIGGGGSAHQASVTPLHVDFHDNFYCLLKGRKRFRLFDPSQARALISNVARVHPNGLVNFVGNETNADGSTALLLAQHVVDHEERYAEDRIEAALETILDAGDPADLPEEEDDDDDQPKHFCRITADEAVSHGGIEVVAAMEAGWCLYLPAGFFHQVESEADDQDGYHMAVNYWYFPPDTDSYDKPYSTECWA